MMNEEANREIMLLKDELETTVQIKNNRIMELQHQLRKQELRNKRLEEQTSFKEGQIRDLKQKIKEMQLFTRERSHALTHKNIRIAQLQQQIEQVSAEKVNQLQNKVEALQKIIIWQEEQINQYLNDHQTYLQELQNLQNPYRYLVAERQLLQGFNGELQKQIEDVQTANVELETWVRKSHQELNLQNEQSNDLIGQLEYMVDVVSGVN